MSGPDRHLVVIGAQRCGTTYLTELLDSHHDVVVARPRRPEPKVFLSAELCGRGREWYHATYFAHRQGEPVLGEKSTSYLELPESANRIRSMLGSETAIVVLLRDPVARAMSNWRFSTESGLESRGLAAALEENLREARPWDPAASSVSPFAYLERGRYASFLVPWQEAFPDSLHVWFTEEVVGAQHGHAAELAELGLDPCRRVRADPGRVNAGATPLQDLSEELTTRLREWFWPSDQALGDLVGREPPWSSGDGGGERG